MVKVSEETFGFFTQAVKMVLCNEHLASDIAFLYLEAQLITFMHISAVNIS